MKIAVKTHQVIHQAIHQAIHQVIQATTKMRAKTKLQTLAKIKIHQRILIAKTTINSST